MGNTLLLYGNTNACSDIFYFVGAAVHDDFFCFTLGGKKCALLSPLEIGRIRRTSRLDEVFDYSEIAAAMPKKSSKSYFDALVWLLKKRGARALEVPEYFPVGVYGRLSEAGFRLRFREGGFFPERAVKTAAEIAEIRAANNVASACFGWVEDVLRSAKIGAGGKLQNGRAYGGGALTSEFLRAGIEKLALDFGADAIGTVAAAGNQACDPHEVGRGRIAARSLIVVDIFPRLRGSGYYGDMTRTFLKGEPTQKQAKIVEAVRAAQIKAMGLIREGVDGASVHAAVEKYFKESGFETKIERGAWGGFFHSTGHGLGLDVHERPSLGRNPCVLRADNVVTVEPGLYYRGVGACRIEDNVVVEKRGAKLLSNFHYNWIID